ncbi:hypothetical protein QYZ44_04150 [Vibrio parahaemolyticus]|nr:hypothetical protein [Vibrio parahaemolyticus]MDN4709152.1 hypothetical protein [Vibrio parahaemolyticus]
MARAKIEQHSLYLMGQLVGPTGEAITGNGLYPLPGFALALPELAVDKTADGSSSKNESPLYFSDSSGRLQGWNTKVQSVKELDWNKLASTPLVISSTKEKLKPVYIPPYLMPAAVMSEDTDWTKRLAQLAREAVITSAEVEVSRLRDWQIREDLDKDVSERRLLVPELAEFFIHKAEAAEEELCQKKARINVCTNKFIVETINIIFIICAFLKFGLSIFSSLPTILRARKLLCLDNRKT